ncbi:Glycine cleavage system H protein [Geodia barretti]|uniref:Glycine cleavage system H protein n=1 Tax=Geodia barretti TaxID=519541 RepID=A0AA35TBY2_GEOBA|nr:Glycine cleavage system H protein [Geodia barretti]
MNPNDRSYTREHEWIIVEDAGTRRALVGITHFAQDQLGDIVYFELPKVGDTVAQLGKMGEVESVKAVSDLYSPVSGEVIEINSALTDRPELTNEDPFGEGWLVRVTMSDATELDSLLSAEEYNAFVAEQH